MKMVPTEGVVVVRDGKRVTPTIGKPFDFTKDEIRYLQANRPEAIRPPVNEGGGEAEDEAEVEVPVTTGEPDTEAAKSGAGKTTAAPKADDDL